MKKTILLSAFLCIVTVSLSQIKSLRTNVYSISLKQVDTLFYQEYPATAASALSARRDNFNVVSNPNAATMLFSIPLSSDSSPPGTFRKPRSAPFSCLIYQPNLQKMKANHYTLILIVILFAGVLTQCSKKQEEDPHNHSLLNKSIDQIRKEIAGKWQFKRTHSEGCGILGCWSKDTTYASNTGDYVYFLTNDTIRLTGYTGFPVKIYEKATVAKVKTFSGPNGFPYNVDSAFRFSMSNGLYDWTMAEIKNDSLVLVDGVSIHYLFKQ